MRLKEKWRWGGGRSADPYPGGEIHDEEEGGGSEEEEEEEGRWRRGGYRAVRKGVERGEEEEEEEEEELKREEKLREVRESYKLHDKRKKEARAETGTGTDRVSMRSW